jgi:hypothetical protein
MDHEKYEISIERDGRMVLLDQSAVKAIGQQRSHILRNTWMTEMQYLFPSAFLYSGKAFRRNRPGGFLKDFFRKGSPEDP